MKRVSSKWLIIIVSIFALARPGAAQDSAYSGAQSKEGPGTSGRLLDSGTTELGLRAGYSQDNPTWVGRTHDRPYFELDIEYARVIETGENWALKYSADLVPVAVVRQPPQGYAQSVPVDLPGRKNTIYGIGVTPAGLQINFFRGNRVQPFINASAGVLYFDDKVPVADSSKFNFSLGLGAGVQIWHLDNQSVILGYTYHHISNGYTAPNNPGLDSDLYYAGYTWRLR